MTLLHKYLGENVSGQVSGSDIVIFVYRVSVVIAQILEKTRKEAIDESLEGGVVDQITQRYLGATRGIELFGDGRP